MTMRRLAVLSFVAIIFSTAVAEEKLSFNRDIRPILSDKCFYCHGPDKNTREADLRLDVREAAIEGAAIVPGNVEESELVFRITSEFEDELMPPPDSHKSLTDAEKELLQRWVEEGAEYEAHWAYLPVARPNVDAEGAAAIDAFVDARLQMEGLKRSPEADDVTLLRRLHFDITGLPPAPSDLVRFHELGLEKYVDALLDSPHYGERMAIEWLDAVRYADTVGYHGDQPLEVSPFRDWVIDSFNSNKPFDEFTIEQIAGDLLPNATIDQRVAAAFNRLGPSSNEGGIQDAEYVAKYQAERVRTTSTAWLGSTMACAECHDHKFDPFLAKDFYQFAAFFSDILEKGAWTGDGDYQEDPNGLLKSGVILDGSGNRGRGPMLMVPTEEESSRLAGLESSLDSARKAYEATSPEFVSAAKKWSGDRRGDLASNQPYDYVYLEDKGEKNEVSTNGWTFVTAKEGNVYQGNVARKQESKELIQHIGNASKKPLQVSEGDVLFAYVFLDATNPPEQLMLQFHRDDDQWNHRAWWGSDKIPYGGIGTERPSHHKRGNLPKVGEWVRLEVPVSEVGLKAGDKITQLAFTQFGGLVYWDTVGVRTLEGEYRGGNLPDEIRAILTKSPESLSDAEQNKLVEHYRTVAPELEPRRKEIAKLEKEVETLTTAIRKVPATISAKRREVRVLPRGNWMDKSGEVVHATPPHFLPGADLVKETEATRLDLAKWIVSKENPLTSRTFVNRLWARLFGNGISNVLDDLGSQGEWPTHPELLDWLAAEFMESGWDVKHLMKTIVMSETYRQSSHATPELLERDPYNRLLARQSGIRLPAELVRDNALAVSGLLNPKVGGPSVKPYQPAGYYQHLNFPRRTYEADMNEDQYRRGLYTHWQRTFLHPAMKAFDAPAREECTMEREESSTPLQALVLLNDPSHVEAAKSLANSSEDLTDLFERVLTRKPTEEELRVLQELYESEKARLAKDEAFAQGLLAVGMKKLSPEHPVEIAARTSVARAVLNLHETITRY